MKLLVDRRNNRCECDLDKLKKRKKDNVLTLNILNNKVNHICYILKSEHRNIINDLNYDNKNAIETCFYYCKPFHTFLLLFYPYIHNYIKCLRSNSLRIYKNLYKYIIKKPNNFISLLFKLKINDEIKKKKVLKQSTYLNIIQKNTEQCLSNDSQNEPIPELLLQNVAFEDIFSKKNSIKILFSRIYLKKHQKNIFRILITLLFYFSLPTFSFSREFFIWYHHREKQNGKTNKLKTSQKEKGNQKHEEKKNRKTVKRNLHYNIHKPKDNRRERVSIKRLYFRVPFFKHVVIPPLRINNYDDNTNTFLKNELSKITIKKKEKNKCLPPKKVSATYKSDSDGVDSDKSESILSDTDDEEDVQNFLKKEMYNSEKEILQECETNHSTKDEKSFSNDIYKSEYIKNSQNNIEHPSRYNIIDRIKYKRTHEKDFLEDFTYFIKMHKKKKKSVEEIKEKFAQCVIKDFQCFFLNSERDIKTRKKGRRKKVYVHEIWKRLINFNDVDFNKNSLIHKACLVSNSNIIFLLLNLNVDLLVYNDKNELPLHCTIYSCDKYIFLLMLHNTIEFLFFSHLKEYYVCKAIASHKQKERNHCGAKHYVNCYIGREINENSEKETKRRRTEEIIKSNNASENRNKKKRKENQKKLYNMNNRNIHNNYKKYIRGNFFYNEKINHQFFHDVVKLYISIFVKIIELGNWEFLKILCNYNKYIFCYILQNFNICYFLCLVANMYNCANAFLKFCQIMLKHFFPEKTERANKRKIEDHSTIYDEHDQNIILKKIKKEKSRKFDENSSPIKENEQMKKKKKNVFKNTTSFHLKKGKKHSKKMMKKKYTKQNFIKNYITEKKMKKSKIEVFYSEECLKHIFVPEPTDYPYMRNQIKSNIPENSSRLDVLVSERHGLLKLDSFVNFKLEKINRKANICDILRVHDISYLKGLVNKIRKYKMDESISTEFLTEINKQHINYAKTEEKNKDVNEFINKLGNLSEMENNINLYQKVDMKGTSSILNRENIQTFNTTKALLETENETTRNEEEEEYEEEEEWKKKKTKVEKLGKMEKMLLIDNDTYINRYSFNCATHASGVVLSAVDYVAERIIKSKKKNRQNMNIFCAIRPPGHHLGTYGAAQFNLTDEDKASGSQGFCILNNIAIGVSYAKCKFSHFEKIAIVDFDIHHGNGTEQIIRNLGLKKIKVNEYIDIYSWKGWKNEYDKKNVFFSSIHAFDGYFYPGTGNDTVELEPYIINVTLKKHMDSKDFLTLFQNNILVHLFYFKPDILFISAGFDGHHLDYVNKGFVKKTTSTYFYVTSLLLSLQNKLSFPIVSVLEGGYNTSNDMSSVFSLSVLEHLLSFYYNGVSYVTMKREKKKKNKDGRQENTNGSKQKECTKKRYETQKAALKFPFISLSREKMDEMFLKYFSVFKEKTSETENLDLTKCSEEYKRMMNKLDEKTILIKKKVNIFLTKNNDIFKNISSKKKDYFSNMKEIYLPYDSYFYDILSHFKIKITRKKNQFISNLIMKGDDPYFIALNDPVNCCDLIPQCLEGQSQRPFIFKNFWENE